MTRPVQSFLRYWLPPAALMALIFILSSQPKADVPDWGTADMLLKKLVHVATYGLLYMLLVRAFRGGSRGRMRPWHAEGLAMIIAVLYGISDEWHQSFVPGREATVRDVLIDALGIVLALIVARRRWFRAACPEPNSNRLDSRS